MRALLERLRRRSPQQPPKRLATYDDFLRRQRRFYLSVTVLMGVLSISSMFVALVAFARPMPVVMWDRSDGQAVLVNDTSTPRMTLEEWQIKAIAERFAERFVGFSGPVARRDAAEAANMMTSRIQHAKIRIGRYDAGDLGGKVHVVLTATRTFTPLVGDGRPQSDYVLRPALLRVPLSPEALLGLKVDFAEVQTFPDLDRLNAAIAAR